MKNQNVRKIFYFWLCTKARHPWHFGQVYLWAYDLKKAKKIAKKFCKEVYPGVKNPAVKLDTNYDEYLRAKCIN